jgi:uncharacterized membrane protein
MDKPCEGCYDATRTLSRKEKAMTWLQRYKIRNYINSSLCVVPLAWGCAAVVFHRIVWRFDLWTRWDLLGYSPDGARAVVGVISSSMLTFIVFLVSMLLLAVQIAVGQLTPRIIAGVFKKKRIKASLGIFLFTYMFSLSAQGRIGDPVPQLIVLLTILFSVTSIGVFLYFVDYMGKSLRPISVCTSLYEEAVQVIDAIYPRLLNSADSSKEDHTHFAGAGPSRTVLHAGKSGVLLAFDTEGLARAATRSGCLIRLVPEVGDFISTGDPLFRIYQGGDSLAEDELRQSTVFGTERTLEQDPAFAFRIIVDISIKALSAAINDPTTGTRCIDQIHRLLRRVGQRDLGDGLVYDDAGRLRFVFPTPDWQDFVELGVSEILLYGAGSIQVVRRLRAMLEDLIASMPSPRVPLLREQLTMLDRAVQRSFADPSYRTMAGAGDYLGMGGDVWPGSVSRAGSQ